jgi:neutral trehalase
MSKGLFFFIFLAALLTTCRQKQGNVPYTTDISKTYQSLKDELLQGWNTWNTYSYLSHVLLPEGLAVNFYLQDAKSGEWLTKAFVWNRVNDREILRPGPHAIDGSYTELSLWWRGNGIMVRTASAGKDLVAMIICLDTSANQGKLAIQPAMLWNKPGEIIRNGDLLSASINGNEIGIYVMSTAGKPLANDTCYTGISLTKPVYISTGRKRTAKEIEKILNENLATLQREGEKFKASKEAYDAMQTVLAWNVIYDPEKDRMITPVSRLWNTGWKGYVLFCWDNYFASYMYAPISRRHALANAIEITNEITENGFVPNFAAAGNLKSRDRSQPPVGSMMVREIYRVYPEKWFLKEVFDKLLAWNRWWPEHRDDDGLLCWGSDPYTLVPNQTSTYEMNNLLAAKYESGLDNSPMYDGVEFDTVTHLMKLADVGLTSLYIADCRALADISRELGKHRIASELIKRADHYIVNLQQLWNDSAGIFLNRYTDSGELSHRISPANFYPLTAGSASPEQARTMIDKNFYDPEKFGGDWIMPSIARSDTGYKDNTYWRGRIWAPMNFLVYLGLCNYDLPDARKDLAEKSMKLFMNEWLAEHHVHENYNAETGDGDDVPNSDAYYHWGALLGMIYMEESGEVPRPMTPLK